MKTYKFLQLLSRKRRSGFLLDSEKIEKFGDALILLAENENLRKTMGAEGRKIIENKYNWRLCVDRMIEIYKNVINKGTISDFS